MLAARALIQRLIDDEDQLFVFPSEVAAEFWRRESLKLSARGAIWEDRFLSWDRFKEGAFQLSQRATPVNRMMRTLFAADLLRRNGASRPLFSSLINPEYADSSPAFLRTLTSMLPELAHYRALPSGHIDPATHTDLTLLWQQYEAFLQENGLFEPSYDRIDVSRLTRHHYIFYPEVIEDWREAEPYLDSTHIHPVPSGEAPATAIRRFANSVQELRSLFFELSNLLEGGIDPADIAITVPRLRNWESLLRRDSQLQGIPLDIRQGRTLAEFPETRLFLQLRELVRGGFGLEAMKSLFTCRAYPWRHRAAGEALVRWGIEHHCAGRYRAGGRSRDLWQEKLSGAGAGEGEAAAAARSLGRFYASLAREATGVVEARGFAPLRDRLQRFVNGWLDTAQWKPESLRVFQFALNALGDLIESEERLTGISVADPYELWLDVLGERLYVPRSAAAGIPVYPYRVSAGIEPRCHFLLGATQEATQVRWRPLSFLREDERAALGVEERNATEGFLNLYLQSGVETGLSFSDVDPSGVELPPGYFVVRGAVEPAGNADGLREWDPYEREALVWSGSAAAPARLYRLQQEGGSFFERSGRGQPAGSITTAPLEDEAVVAAVVESLSDDAGRLRISPTRLDRFGECPFSFLFSTALRVEERSYEIEWEEPKLIGALLHEILRRLLDPTVAGDHRDRAAGTLSTVFAEWEARGDALAPPVWFGLRMHLLDRIERFLEVEDEQFGGLSIAALEESYRHVRGDVLLEGRIDRISVDDAGVVLVDYKRNNRLRPADLLGRSSPKTEDEQGPSSYQIPFYIILLEAAGLKVQTAAYYDVEKGRYDIVFDTTGAKAWAGPDEMERLLRRTEEAILGMDERVRSGAWTVPDPRSGCEECRLRAVCRMKYTVR